jgi:hypothetical protein
MKEVGTTAGNDGSQVNGSILKGEAGAGAGAEERKVRFKGEPEVRIIPASEIKTTEERRSFLTKAVDSSLGRGAISTFSEAFGLDQKRMTEIVGDYAKGNQLSDENKKYIDDQFKNNSKLNHQLSNAFPIGGAGDGMKKVVESFDDEEPKKKGTGASNNELFDTKTKVLMGLCIACIILATGGLPLLGGLFGFSQGTLIAGAVLTGLGAMGAVASGLGAFNSIKDKNKITPDSGSQAIVQEGNPKSTPDNAMESLMKLVTNGLGEYRNDKVLLDKVGSIEGEKKSSSPKFDKEQFKVSDDSFDNYSVALRDIKSPKLEEDSQLQSKKSLTFEALNLEKLKSDNKSTNTNPSSEASWASRMLATNGVSKVGSREI